MWIKLGVAAAVLTYAGVSLASVDYRTLYNEMYPANGLKRDVLGLCQASKPTFVRAVEQDRVSCYDSMPNAIERAIGWVRTSARLAALRAPTGVELAERLMQQAELRQPSGLLRFLSTPDSGAIACDNPAVPVAVPGAPMPAANGLAALPAAEQPNDELARRIARGDSKLLAQLGVTKPEAHPGAARKDELPVLSLTGSRDPAPPIASASTAASSAGARTAAPLITQPCGTRA
jgi:hypothetical protein